MTSLRTTFACACLLLASTASYASEINYNIIHLNAEARREVPNDLMQVTLSIQHQAPAANRAADMVNKDMAWALKLLNNKKTIRHQTSNYSTHPVYQKERINAWSARQNLQLSSEDFDKLSDVVGLLQERLTVNQMHFSAKPSTRDKVHNTLISEALTAYKNKAKIIQKSMQASAYDIVELNISPNHQQPVHRERMMMSRAQASPAPVAVQSGNSNIVVSFRGRIKLKGLKRKTRISP
jgi:predicted secreted protein